MAGISISTGVVNITVSTAMPLIRMNTWAQKIFPVKFL